MNNNIYDQKELTLKFLRGELNPGEETELQKWIKGSAENRKQFLYYQQLFKENLTTASSAETYKEWNNLTGKLKLHTGGTGGTRRLIRVAYISGIAAAFLIGLLIATLIPFSGNNTSTVPIVQTFSTPGGARTHFALPDGTIVWLNAGTQLTFSQFEKDERKVELEGEAYFKVMRDEKRPFIISTGFGEVKVLGTSFDVKAYSDDLFATTVEEGLVKVTAENGTGAVLVRPGEQTVLSGNYMDVKSVETQIYTSWKDGVLIFKKDALEEIVKKLERWYNVDIELAPNMELKNYRFTGTIEMESLPEVLELIRITAPIKYRYDAKKRRVELDMKD